MAGTVRSDFRLAPVTYHTLRLPLLSQHDPPRAVISTKPGVAFTTPDVEADCVKLLATGLFR